MREKITNKNKFQLTVLLKHFCDVLIIIVAYSAQLSVQLTDIDEVFLWERLARMGEKFLQNNQFFLFYFIKSKNIKETILHENTLLNI